MKTTYSILLAITLAGLARAQAPDVQLPPLPPEQPAAPTAPAAPPVLRRDLDDAVQIMSKVHVAADESVGDAISILGGLEIQGEVRGDAVAISGNALINGPVGRDVVVVGGNLELGPKADIGGDVVTVGGGFTRDPAARISGEIVHVGPERDFKMDVPLQEMLKGTTLRGRPLAIGPHMGMLWVLTAFWVASYFFLALLFPEAVTRCGDVLIERPGATLLTTFLTILAVPLLFLLLAVTVVGIPIAIFVLPLVIFGFTWFGKASISALIGRRLTGNRLHPAPAALVGSLLAVALYLIPYFGALVALVLAALGFGCVTTVVLTDMRKPKPAPVIPPPLEMPPVITSVLPATSLPRAGFWIRMIALFIDVVPIGIFAVATEKPPIFPILIVIYTTVMWRLKGATLGGMICHLKVVRLDERPMNWSTGIVRALSCFISLLFVFLGFLWIAFDREKQGWHDKIAGTIVIHPPRGVSLV